MTTRAAAGAANAARAAAISIALLSACVSGDFKDPPHDAEPTAIGDAEPPQGWTPDAEQDAGGDDGTPFDDSERPDAREPDDVEASPCPPGISPRCVAECGSPTSFAPACGPDGWECSGTAPIDDRTCGSCVGALVSCCDDDGRLLSDQTCLDGVWTCPNGAPESCPLPSECPGAAPMDCIDVCGSASIRPRQCRDAVWQCPVGLLSFDECPPACEGETPVCCDAEGAIVGEAHCVGVTWRCDEPTGLDSCGMLAPTAMTGAYVESQWLDCGGARAGIPPDPIASLLFYGGDQYELTFRSHQMGSFRDYWGSYVYDAATGRLTMTVTGGGNRLVHTDLDGTVVQLADGSFELRDMWLGSADDDEALGPPVHCGHALRKLGGGG